jgi:hypothetical protein
MRYSTKESRHYVTSCAPRQVTYVTKSGKCKDQPVRTWWLTKLFLYVPEIERRSSIPYLGIE